MERVTFACIGDCGRSDLFRKVLSVGAVARGQASLPASSFPYNKWISSPHK